VSFAENGIEHFGSEELGGDDMEKIVRSGLIAALLICSMQAMAQDQSTPMEKVRVLAGTHAVTTGKRHGVYWVEVEGSDTFGIGATLDEAANDFLADADLIGNEANRPNPRAMSPESAPQIDCAAAYCL
jgi:hypothetical protein